MIPKQLFGNFHQFRNSRKFRSLRRQSRRNYSSKSFDSMLTVCTWLPRVKKRHKTKSHKAKKGWKETNSRLAKLKCAKRSSEHSVEILGHAAAKLKIGVLDKEMRELLVSKLGEKGKGIVEIQSDMSWFPKTDSETDEYIKTGEKLSEEEYSELKIEQEKLIGKTDSDKVSDIAFSVRRFLNDECAAINSNIEHDTFQYGPLVDDGIRKFTELDFKKVTSRLLDIMEPEIKYNGDGGKILNMSKIAPHGTYYGKDMLTFFDRVVSPETVCDDNSSFVCTTAVLEVLRAGLDEESFKEIVKETLENSDHKLATTDMTRRVINKAAATQPLYKAEVDNAETNTTKDSDISSSKDDEPSPPSTGLI